MRLAAAPLAGLLERESGGASLVTAALCEAEEAALDGREALAGVLAAAAQSFAIVHLADTIYQIHVENGRR